MKPILIGMLAETFVHPGVGQAIAAIDLPVARERTTDYPFIPGSGMKGGWKSWAKESAKLDEISRKKAFGENDNAGSVLFSDARLLLLPVRSLNSAYFWVTCPMILERLQRDLVRCGHSVSYDIGEVRKVEKGKFFGASSSTLTLEERDTEPQGALPVHVADDLGPLAPCIAGRIAGQLAVVHDDEFAWFARYALPVAARNKLHDESKISENLWYEETLPPDTVTYTLLAERDGGSGSVEEIIKAVAGSPYCQFGGNETLGQGWFQMTVVHQSGGLANAG